MRRFLGYYAVIPLMCFGFGLATFTGVNVVLAVVCIYPFAVCVVGGLIEGFGLGCFTYGTCVGLNACCHVRGLLRYYAVIPLVIFIYDITTFTGLLVLLIVMLRPFAVCMIRGLIEGFGLGFLTYRTGIEHFTHGQMRCGCLNHTCIPFVRLISNITASGTSLLMLFGVVLFPSAVCMVANNGNSCRLRCKRNIRRCPSCRVNILQSKRTGYGCRIGDSLCFQSKLENVSCDCRGRHGHKYAERTIPVTAADQKTCIHKFKSIGIKNGGNTDNGNVLCICQIDRERHFFTDIHRAFRCGHSKNCAVCRVSENGHEHRHDHERRKKS